MTTETWTLIYDVLTLISPRLWPARPPSRRLIRRVRRINGGQFVIEWHR
jgi:hypothetical protein